MGRLLETLPSPAPARTSPAGVGSAASNRSSPRTPAGAAVVAGGDGGGGGSSSGSSSSGSRSRPSTPPSGRVSHLHQGEVVHPQFPLEPVPREDDPGNLKKSRADADVAEEDTLHAPTWVLDARLPPCSSQSSRFATTIAHVAPRPRTNCRGTMHRQHHQDQQHPDQL